MNDGETAWVGGAKVRARRVGDVVEVRLDTVTSQARIYKQTLREFFRTSFDIRPRWGDFEVEIMVDLLPNMPPIDLDNIAKAVLDGLTKAVFHDDSQIVRLVLEKRRAESECVVIRAWPRLDAGL
jgi:crossover junction endodeoxyribonuclease RusA